LSLPVPWLQPFLWGCAETIRSVGCFHVMIDNRKDNTPNWEKLAEVAGVAVVFFLFL
jgi:hypothetical protein